MQFQEFPKWINVPGHEDGALSSLTQKRKKTMGCKKKTETAEEVKRKPGRPKKVSQ